MKEVTIKIQFDDEGCYDGHGDDVAELIKDGIETYLRIDLEGDGVIKKGWTVEVVNCISDSEINKMAFEWSSERSIGNAEQDSQCTYDYAQGMIAMQKLLLNEV
jgi:hypothetical protein